MKIVKARYFEGYNMSIAQLWGSGPKMNIVCGECGGGFSRRVPTGVNRPVVTCPCGTPNLLNLRWS